MRPAPLDIQTSGNLGGKRIEMTMDMHSLQFAMSTLTDMYADPIKAIIREYSTNARDAHIDAGKANVPIEIHSPSALSPFFKIRDFGNGMSVDFIENVYSQYWNSTKRDTDSQVGMLGLGSKSGLTYTAQFQIVSIHQGVKILVMVSKDEYGSGVMEIVDTSITDEPSGVEIIIPVKYTSDFTARVEHFFKYWTPGTVLVDDKQPEFIGDHKDALWVTDNIVALPGQGTSYVVMGNVPYKADGLAEHYGDYHLVAFVEIGDVAFPPNREELMYTDKTKETISKLSAEAKAGIANQIQAEIDAQPTYLEALKTHDKRSFMISHNYTYKGEELKQTWEFNYGEAPEAMSFAHSHERHAVTFPRHIDWKNFSQYLTITGFTGEKLPTNYRQKIRHYIENLPAGERPYKVFLMEKHPDTKRLAEIRTVPFETIKAIKLVRAKSDKKVVEYNTLTAHGYTTTKADLDDTKNVMYIVPGRRKIKWKNLTTILKDYEIVILYKNELDRFKKANPDSEDLEQWIKDKVMFAKAGLTKTDRRRMTDVDYYSRVNAQKLDPTRIDDPEMVAFINACNAKQEPLTDTMKDWYAACEFARAIEYAHGEIKSEDITDPFNKYPLARGNCGSNKEHVYLYMNAIYQKEKNNQV
jgi:hypothetical protein